MTDPLDSTRPVESDVFPVDSRVVSRAQPRRWGVVVAERPEEPEGVPVLWDGDFTWVTERPTMLLLVPPPQRSTGARRDDRGASPRGRTGPLLPGLTALAFGAGYVAGADEHSLSDDAPAGLTGGEMSGGGG